MKPYNLRTLASAMNGTLLQPGDGEVVITSGASTDTRTIKAGALFFALRGENFDAHEFLDQASAAAALVVDCAEKVPVGRPAIVVEDVLSGLQQLAQWYRQELGIPVIAITGSNGKTSTKDFTRSVLSQRFRVNATLGNLNNHIGLPLSVLATDEDHEVGVFEMGMNHSGELAPLCEIARPDISMITNVGSAHIENMGSREAIAEEKGTVARALTKEGTLLIPSDSDFIGQYREASAGRVLPVGQGATVRAENLVTDIEGSRFDLVIEELGSISANIPVTGVHMVNNALLAAGAGFLMGLSLEEIVAGLSETQLTGGRLCQWDHQGVQVIDDTYNANPESVAAALETLAALPSDGNKIVALGKMAELGNHTEDAYRNAGQLAAEKKLRLIVVGSEAATMATAAREAGGEVDFFKGITTAAEFLKTIIAPGDIVLFKGSRAAAMEKVMEETFPPPK